MERLYVAEITKTNNGEQSVTVIEEISQEELIEVNSIFSNTGIFHQITEIQRIVVSNGMRFKGIVNSKFITEQYKQGVSERQLILEANRAVFNYAASIKSFLDIANRLLKKNKPDKKDEFEELTHRFYDTSVEYRFWCNFRNYIVHCSMPYTGFRANVDTGCGVFCKKEHLLEFTNWKQSRVDLEQMDEHIELSKLVDNMNAQIIALYMAFFAFWVDEIASSIKSYGDFCRKHHVERPIIVKSRKENRLTSMQPLPAEKLFDALNVLKSNPNIQIINNRTNI